MGDALAHRGPDDEGLYVDETAGLAHRRLSIIDLKHGHQPMQNVDGSVCLAYNGEIYNYHHLRSQLIASGSVFQTHSDTEVVLKAYEVFGEDCVKHLRGMFAFAIWDVGRKRLFLARDRLGIKPLYYAVSCGKLFFASEIKAIVAAGGVRAALNDTVIPELLANRFVAGPQTLFRGIQKLLPGHTLTWSKESGIRTCRYWHLPETLTPSDAPIDLEAKRLLIRLEESLRSHLVSDVPIGLFLSGGLDSTALGALMAPMVHEPIKTFSVVFRNAAEDESHWARMASAAIGSEHYEVDVTPEMFFDALPQMVWQEDEPLAFPSSVALYYLSRLAAEHVKVVISGEGSDELFLGYNRYRVTAVNEALGRLYGASIPQRWRNAVKANIERMPRGIRHYMARSFLGQPPGIRGLFFENFSLFPASMQAGALRDPELLWDNDPYQAAGDFYQAAPGTSLDRMSYADLQTYLVELLMKQDQMSMAASVETRVPFLDHHFVEYAAALPARYKLHGWTTKAILREAVREHVPPAILKRRKMGFPTPVAGWLRGAFTPLLEEFVLSDRALSRSPLEPEFVRRLVATHRSREYNHGERLWFLLNLEFWQRIFVDGEAPASLLDAAFPHRKPPSKPLRLVPRASSF